MKKLFIRTFGCQMNEADSQEMALAFYSRGYSFTDTQKDADAILVNTCTVRQHAEDRAVSYIGRLQAWKERKPGRLVVVAGCAAQRLGKKLKTQFPFIDLVCGAISIDDFPDMAGRILTGTGVEQQHGATSLSSYVTVMRGCGHACSYCIVPSVRGQVKCRPPQDIVTEIKAKVAAGTREITLLGQTVNAYRHPECGNFGDLLRLVNGIDGLARIRFMSPHPLYLDESMMDAIAGCDKVAKHLHLPAQSGSDRILKAMNRGYTRAQFLERIARLRKKADGIAISTDFIVGFPSETESDFEDTLALAEEGKFAFAYCFKYSPRQGTTSAEMNETVSGEETERRLDRLLSTVKKISQEQLELQVGKDAEILLETRDRGKTSWFSWAVIDSDRAPGDLVRARITGRKDSTLIARIEQ